MLFVALRLLFASVFWRSVLLVSSFLQEFSIREDALLSMRAASLLNKLHMRRATL
jgi:hypothetical protein